MGAIIFSGPFPRLIKLESLLLTRARLRLEIVNPTDQRRKAHQNRFGAAARLQAEKSSSIVEKIEFPPTSTAVELILTLTIAERLIHTALRNRQGNFQKKNSDIAKECKNLFTISLQII